MKPGIMIYPLLLNFFHTARPRDLMRDAEAAFWVYEKILQPNYKATSQIMEYITQNFLYKWFIYKKFIKF